ncbi:MAG: hypothetical protein GY719_03175 [bacterium]|nr:hypothetical protein [bacterium]
MISPNAQPSALADLDLAATRMYEVELSIRELLVKATAALHRQAPVRAFFDHRHMIEMTMAVRTRVSFQRLDDQPLIGVGLADFGPQHGVLHSGQDLSAKAVDKQSISRRRQPSRSRRPPDRGGGACLAAHSSHRHTLGMKTAISVPDHVFEDADRLAERLAKTRSQLYTEAMVEYLTRHDPDTVTLVLAVRR